MSGRSTLLFSLLSAVVMFVALAIGIPGCTGVKAPDERAIARGAVLATAEAVRAADQACAAYGAATKDLSLLESCEKHYDTARIALTATASAVDLWERAGTRESVACALVDALTEVDAVGAELGRKGGTVPPILTDAKQLVAALGGCSRG